MGRITVSTIGKARTLAWNVRIGYENHDQSQGAIHLPNIRAIKDNHAPNDEKRVIKRITLPSSTSFNHAFGIRRVALYCRVSSKMERQLNSLLAQMDFEMQDIIDHPNWQYVDTYADIGSGRSIITRSGFKRLMAD